VALGVALVALVAGVHASNLALDRGVEVKQSSGDVGPLPDGRALRVASLGFERLVADLFWLRTVFYVGDERSAEAGYPAVAALAELVTDIDPYFQTAYVVMSGAISGLGGDPEAAIALLEKGARYVSYWKIHFLLGFHYFMDRLDYGRAGGQMRLASELGGPPYLPLLSARLYAQAGDPETALAFVKARLAETEEPETRRALEKRYWDLWIQRDLDQLDRAIERYRERVGRPPEDPQALVHAGLLGRLPVDPKGGAYRIERGRAATDLPHERLEVHRPRRPERGEDPGS
jgi:tetratricopeptide (TPR) repeat protein